MNILITNIKDYNLFAKECDSKGITWKSGDSMVSDGVASLCVSDALEDNRSIILTLRNKLITWDTYLKKQKYADYVLYEDYIKNKSAKIVIV